MKFKYVTVAAFLAAMQVSSASASANSTDVMQKAEVSQDLGITAENTTVWDKLVSIISEVGAIDPINIVPAAELYKDLGLDSLDLFEIICACEDAFDIEIPWELAEKITTVIDLYDTCEYFINDIG